MVRFSILALLASTLLALPQATVSSQVPLQGGDVHTSDSWSYENCGLSTDIVQIESIDVSPDPPQPGEDLTVTVRAFVTEPVEEGAYADVTVKLGLVKILSKQFDVCEEARNANASIQCPVEPGEYEVRESVALPKEIPPAKFVVNVRGYTVDDEDMLCLNLKVDFLKNPFGIGKWLGRSD